MKKAHEGWGIKSEHFDIMKKHYENSLIEQGIKLDAVKEIISAFEWQRESVLNKKSLYDRLGGEPAITATFDLFYKKMMANPETSQFFQNTNMIRQRDHQKKFQMMILGGPDQYTGRRSMQEAHKGLGISNDIFDKTKKCLEDALTDLQVPRGLVVEVIINFEKFRPEVIEENKSLYDRVGGKPAVAALVNLFYIKVR
jgi:hemoglobin